MKFEWDDEKARLNLEKHSISFEVASEIFNQDTLCTFEDDRFDYGEIRQVVLGEISGIYLYVIFTMRGESIRIISARKASRKERTAYYDYIKRTAIRDSPEDG